MAHADPSERVLNTGVNFFTHDEEGPATMLFPSTAEQSSLDQGTSQLIEATNQSLEALGSPLRFGE